MYTKEFIQEKLSTDPKWIERGLVAIYGFQTEVETKNRCTIETNGMGFNKPDSGYLTYCSRWVMSGKKLSGHHILKCGKKLPKYWKQIQYLIEKKG